MKCPNCGVSILDGSSFCQRCGLQVGTPQFTSSQLRPQPTNDNKVLWIVVIVVILVVVLPIVLSAVLYFMVLGFGGTSTQTPEAMYQKSTIANGQEITIVAITKTDVPWDDVKIQLSDGTNIGEWSPTKAFQSTTTPHNYSAAALGTLTVCLVLTDVSGNGFVSGTDYFQIFTYSGATGFASGTQYSAVLLYQPTGELCGQPMTFTG
ncbi:MAG: zinc ribbon domain-containing protein [Euryarchaeota archaeon]|nr:zinc ribbon domain-containing protein [Euryarchaeota archaeon]